MQSGPHNPSVGPLGVATTGALKGGGVWKRGSNNPLVRKLIFPHLECEK